MALFKYENELFDTLGKMGDCLVLSLLWSVSSLPVVTMGAATSALYHTVTKVVRNQAHKAVKRFYIKSNVIKERYLHYGI